MAENCRSRSVDALLASMAIVALAAGSTVNLSGAWASVLMRGSGPASGCPTVTYLITLDGASDAIAADVRWAFASMTSATGIDFVESSGGGTDVVVAWDPMSDEARARHQLGVAVPANGAAPSGRILITQGVDLATGTDHPRTWRGVMLHELGHLVGLVHSADRGDLMFKEAVDRDGFWSSLELGRLADVGRRLGCGPGQGQLVAAASR